MRGLATPTMMIDDVVGVCELLAKVSDIFGTVAFLCSRCILERETCMRKGRLKDEMLLAYNFNRTEAHGLLIDVDDENFVDKLRSTTLPWVVPFAAIQKLLRLVKSSFDSIRGVFVLRQFNGFTVLSSEVQRCTTRFDHVITATRVNKQLAKPNLFKGQGMDLMSSKTVTVFESLREFKRLHVQKCLTRSPDQDADVKEGLDSATAILN